MTAGKKDGEVAPHLSVRRPNTKLFCYVAIAEVKRSVSYVILLIQRFGLQTASHEGYLTKLGNVKKSWKNRWFVLWKNELKYFRDRAVSIWS